MTLRSPGIGTELSVEQKLACAFRILADAGWTQNLAGHITQVVDDDGSMLVNRWGVWWDEIRATDIVRVDPSGRPVDPAHQVTPAIHIHTELHRVRPDAPVLIHNHPFFTTVLAGIGELPMLTEQTGCMFEDEMVLVNEYTGGVDTPDAGEHLAESVGKATVALLANHGALVTGETIEEATYRAVSLERVSRLSYYTMLTGRAPIEMPDAARADIKAGFRSEATVEMFWNGAVRTLLGRDRSCLD